MRMRPAFTLLGVLLSIMVLSLSVPALGADTYWQHDPATLGDWFDPLNWTLGVPTDNDVAYVRNDGTAQILNDQAQAATLNVGTSDAVQGAGGVEQSGGTARFDHLWIQPTGTYRVTGGTLAFSNNPVIDGVLEFATGPWTLANEANLLDLQGATFTDASQATFTSAPTTLTIFPSGSDPASEFGTFSPSGLTHVAGTTLVVPADYHLVLDGDFYDPLQIQGGSIVPSTPYTRFLPHGDLLISDGGELNVGSHSLDVAAGASVMIAASGGTLTCQGLNLPETTAGVSASAGFTQDGGTVNVNGDFAIGYATVSALDQEGTYLMSGGILHTTGDSYVGWNRDGHFVQSGGTHTVDQTLYLAMTYQSVSSYELSGSGQLYAASEVIGMEGDGIFNQTGGENHSGKLHLVGGSGAVGSYTQTAGLNQVDNDLLLGYLASYNLSGSGEVTCTTLRMSSADFIQSGGTNTVTQHLDMQGSTYTLTSGVLSCGTLTCSAFIQNGGSIHTGLLELPENLGYFWQTAGSIEAAGLDIGPGSEYYFPGGTIEVTRQFSCAGTLYPYDQPLSLQAPSGIIDLTNPAGIVNASLATLTAGPQTLVIGDLTPWGNVLLDGFVLIPGGSVTIPAGRSVLGWGTLPGHVDLQGTLDGHDGQLDIVGGLSLSAPGLANLGTGGLKVEDLTSGMDGGQLTVNEEHVGFAGAGRFAQSGGDHTVGSLNLGYNVGSAGAFDLSGGRLSDTSCIVGRAGSGSFSQTGGTHTVYGTLSLGQLAGGQGTYELGGTGVLDVGTFNVAYSGAGHFIQTGGQATFGDVQMSTMTGTAGSWTQSGGTSTVLNQLRMALSSGRTASVELSGTGGLSVPGTMQVGLRGTATFSQTGSSTAAFGTLAMDGPTGAESSYALADSADLTSVDEQIGTNYGARFTQTGGTHTVTGTMYLSYYSAGKGNYLLSDGVLAAQNAVVGSGGTATLTQTGGQADVSGSLVLGQKAGSKGTVSLSGAGELTAGTMRVGDLGTGIVSQTGGAARIGMLELGTKGTYDFTGGTLQINRGFSSAGAVDFHGGALTLDASGGGILDLRNPATFKNTSQATLLAGPDTLVFYDPLTPPSSAFPTITIAGLMHVPGSPLTIPSDRTVIGWGTIGDRVNLAGRIEGNDGAVNLNDGLTMTGEALAHLGSGTLVVQDAVSGMEGGELTSGIMRVGQTGTGSFTQSGGSASASTELRLGYNAGANGTYHLSGSSSLTAGLETIGDGGTGLLTQDGGTHTVNGPLYIGYQGTGSGQYELSGGTLAAQRLYIGYSGAGRFSVTQPTTIEVSTKLSLGTQGVFEAVPGTTIRMTGSEFENKSTQESSASGLGNTTLIYEPDVNMIDLFEVAGTDLGRNPAGFVDNFALAGIELDNQAVLQLTDSVNNGNRNGVGGAAEALYVDKLTLEAGSGLNLNGLHLYVCDLEDQGGTIGNGEIISMCPGDADGNWRVDSADLATWQRNYDPLGTTRTFAQGDWDGNGSIDSADLATWQRSYHPLYMGPASLGSPEVTPEPATLLLVGTGLLTLAGLRRRRLMS